MPSCNQQIGNEGTTHILFSNSINTINTNSKASGIRYVNHNTIDTATQQPNTPSVGHFSTCNEASGDVTLVYVRNNYGLMQCVEMDCNNDTNNTHCSAVYKLFLYVLLRMDMGRPVRIAHVRMDYVTTVSSMIYPPVQAITVRARL